MRKKDIIFKLEKEIERAQKRQRPSADKDSGHIKGLKNAITVIKKHR